MRSKIPQDVDVGLHETEIDADRVDELYLAYLPPRIISRIRCTAGV